MNWAKIINDWAYTYPAEHPARNWILSQAQELAIEAERNWNAS